jgi:hypothetical protein
MLISRQTTLGKGAQSFAALTLQAIDRGVMCLWNETDLRLTARGQAGSDSGRTLVLQLNA